MKFNAYYNGSYTYLSELKIPVSDRSICFGDGVYDAFIGRNKKIYLRNLHINRFLLNAKKLDLHYDFSIAELNEIFDTLTNGFDGDEFFLYVQLTRNARFRSHSYDNNAKTNLLVTVTPIQTKSYDTILNLCTYEDVRSELCNVKTLNLLPSVLASKHAERQFCDEAIFHRNGIVTECAHSNILIVKEGVLMTHPLNNHILPGITRQKILEIAKENSINVLEVKFTLEDLINADDVIITSTTKLAKRGRLKNSLNHQEKCNEISIFLCKALEEDYLNETKKEM